jgi:hypothetical protein
MLRTTALGLAVATTLAGAGAALAAGGPQISAHPIFSGGMKTFHVGAVIEVDTIGHNRAPKLTQLCVDPAPIDRPACAAGTSFGPSAAGQTKLTATFADGSTTTKTLTVHAAAKKVGGMIAVPGHIVCDQATLYGSYDQKHKRLTHPLPGRVLPRDTNVAIYNRVGTGRFVWAYASGKAGFAKLSCVNPGLASS